VLDLLIALPLAAAMLLTLRWCRKGDAWGVVTLVLLCVVWLRVDKAFEGPQVLSITHQHGLVLSDLLAIVVGACGVVGWLRHRRPSAPIDGREPDLRDQAAVADGE
jgi:hypothetical protein